MDTEDNVRKYWAFISYSHADKAWADWLHRSLENYPMPRDLVGRQTPADAPVPKRFVPVFRDREELPTATDLAAVIGRALRHARFLVVICSPRSAKSPWVEKEIIEYKRMHGDSRVMCLIVDGEPWASGGRQGFSEADECFPRAVRFQLGHDGELSDKPTEPIAADAREGKDGRENAVIKLMAGLLGVGFDDLRRREQEYQRRRLRRFQATAAVFGLLFVAAVSAAIYAVKQKRTALHTLSQSDMNLAVAARKSDAAARQVAYLARSLRSDPANPLARMAAYSTLVHHKIHPPVGPALRHPAAVLAAAGSADGKWILTSSGERIYLWSRPDHKLLTERNLGDGTVNALVAHPSGDGWLAGTAKGGLHFIGLKDLKSEREVVRSGETAILGLCWNPERSVLAVGLGPPKEQGGGWLLQTTVDGKELSRHRTEHLTPEYFAWSADGAKLATAGNSPYFYVTDAGDRGNAIREMQGKLCISGIFFTPERTLRTIDIAAGVVTWNAETGQAIGKPDSIEPMPARCALSPDGSHFVGFHRGPTAYLHDTADGKVRTEPLSQAFTVNKGVYLDERHVLLMSENGLAQVRSLRSETPAAEFLPFHPGYPDIGVLSDDGKLLAAACSSDSLVRIYDLRTSKQLGRPLRFPSDLHAICFSENDQFLSAICWDGKVRRVEWKRGLRFLVSEVEVVTPIDSGFDTLDEVRFQVGGRLAAVPDPDGIKIIDLIEGAVARVIPVQGGVQSLAWSPDGKTIAVASRDQVLSFHPHDGSAGKSSVRTILGAPVIDLAWSPDARTIATLTNSDQVECFSVEDGRPFGTGFSTGSSCMRISWASNGKWLVASDGNDVSKLWDPETGLDVARLPDGGSGQMAPLDVPLRGAVALSGEKGFYLVSIPLIQTTPEWLPTLLEGIGGGSLGDSDTRPLLDPDAWMAAEKTARAGKRDALWSPVVDWLLDRNDSRQGFPGALMSEPEVATAMDPVSTRAFDALVQRANVLWKSGDENKMAEALVLMEKALAIKPGHIQLLLAKRQIGQNAKRPNMVREACSAISASADSPLADVLEAKFIEAGSWLVDEPKDRARSRKLLEEILAEDPDRGDAKNMLESEFE